MKWMMTTRAHYYAIRRVVYTDRFAYFVTLDTPEGLINSRDLTLDELRGRIRIIREQGWKRKELNWSN